ncbi:TPA: hypothetical protein TT573_001934 [Streptococcus equi subsp. zooepidemicus]|nr:hypothetical protein [Streptococcus equi subsp. zooepidemicus]
MANPTWDKTLAEVLGQNTVTRELQSRDGKTYTAELVPTLEVLSTGSVTENNDGTYTYNVVDTVNHLDYAIKAPALVEADFGSKLVFKDVKGGRLNSGRSWFKAEHVSVAK